MWKLEFYSDTVLVSNEKSPSHGAPFGIIIIPIYINQEEVLIIDLSNVNIITLVYCIIIMFTAQQIFH